MYYAPSSFVFNVMTGNTPQHWRDEFSAIVHCAAYTDVPGAETPDGNRSAAETNIIGTYNMANLAKTLGLPLIYISTDYVYSGTGVYGGYTEADAPKPFNYYGHTKHMGEAFVQEPDDLIIRTSFKPNEPWVYTHAFSDLYTSADYVDIIAPMINALIISGECGIYNVGTERKSIYDLAAARNSHISKMSKNSLGFDLPDDVSMNTDKYDGLGLKL